MPIDYSIDHGHRLVIARGSGKMMVEDFFEYQRSVWSRPEVSGYDELVDMTAVEEIVHPSASTIESLASLAASMDVPDRKSKFAIVAPSDLAFGLGRMFEARRHMEAKSTKEVRVFRVLSDALEFLGREGMAIGAKSDAAEL